MSGSSTVKTRLIAVPPPSVFLETIKDHARSQALSHNGPTVPGPTEPGTTEPGTTTPSSPTTTPTTPTEIPG